jgi:Fe2+ transport system protein FeoA
MEVFPMELAIVNRLFGGKAKKKNENPGAEVNNLTLGQRNHPYRIKAIQTEDKTMKDFLFSLGCFEGEKITIISVLADNYVIHIKDARYSIDKELAKAILI